MAVLFTPRTKRCTRIAVTLAVLLIVFTDFFTLSRGGLASLLLGLFIGIPTIAMRGYGIKARLAAPLAALVVFGGALFAITSTDNPLMARVKQHPLYTAAVKNVGSPQWREKMHDVFWYSFDRGTYIQSALRAWKSNPVWGIGPGQHSSRWAEFAATDDGIKPVNGDLSTMKKPRVTNAGYHLYEVHSDWTQLLEEYGIVGLVLFIIPMLVLLAVTYASQSAAVAYALNRNETEFANSESAEDEDEMREESRRRSSRRRHRSSRGALEDESISSLELALPLASLLACLVMIFHSFGDFSFQIPSITWAFGAMLAAGILATNKPYSVASR